MFQSHGGRAGRWLGFAGGALVAFALVAAVVLTGWLSPWDRTVFGWLYSGESPWPLGATPGRGSSLLHAVVPWCERIADARVLLALISVGAIVMFSRRWDRAALFLAGSVAVVLLSSLLRSEERRVGKECRSRWSPEPGK